MVRYWRHRGKEIFKRLEPHIEKYFPYHKPELDRVSPQRALLAGRKIQAPFDLAVGQVVPFGQELTASFPSIIKVRVHKLCLNRFLLKYYYQTATYWTHNQGINTNIGDIVLIEKTDPPIAFHTVFKLRKIVYPVGDIRDPVTGLRCEGAQYSVEDLQKILQYPISQEKINNSGSTKPE
ncbi:28S ribosomal protein S17 mitochondrial [Paragonimus skrjabini miyazakii]|uniref:28S ribosomal protein S17 mitochondrial n=1 Tax=Paragonimus skrjabini miyazakii TaxID=59628 RepID=A0A8S9YHT0_9TREM|nr:28S ribosomal protein S17 mitochondrial [Paragonimus skrjabini miyazakii]